MLTDEQIIGFLKRAQTGLAVAETCRKCGFSDATFYQCLATFGSMEASDACGLRVLAAENSKLKYLLAETPPRQACMHPCFQLEKIQMARGCSTCHHDHSTSAVQRRRTVLWSMKLITIEMNSRVLMIFSYFQ